MMVLDMQGKKTKNNPLKAERRKLKEKAAEVTLEQENISLILMQKLMQTLLHIIANTDTHTHA